jgi:hypothetical protein
MLRSHFDLFEAGANSPHLQEIKAVVVQGYQVASGRNGDPRFPGGTLNLQAPHFRTRGLDLDAYYRGTVNVSVAPLRYEVVQPRFTFRSVKWHLTAPSEDFSFFDVGVMRRGDAEITRGLIYYPHPETKPEHHQRADVIELLLPFLPNLSYGAELRLYVPAAQIAFIAQPAG